MNGKEESMWKIIRSDILVHIVDPNFFELRLWHCCV